MIARISPRARGSPVFCISILTAMSPVLYKAAWYELQVRNWSKAHGRRAELNSRLTGGMAPNRTTTSAFQKLSRNESGDCSLWRGTPLENGPSRFLLKKLGEKGFSGRADSRQ
jgi:hypothetical protein